MKKFISTLMVTAMMVASSVAPKAARAGETENILAIILGATVAMSAISAFDRTTNGDRVHYARLGVLDIQKEAMDYLATSEAGPSLLKAYEFTAARSTEKLTLDQYAETFVSHSDEIEAKVVEAARTQK